VRPFLKVFRFCLLRIPAFSIAEDNLPLFQPCHSDRKRSFAPERSSEWRNLLFLSAGKSPSKIGSLDRILLGSDQRLSLAFGHDFREIGDR
jgi:hypothetical protein